MNKKMYVLGRVALATVSVMPGCSNDEEINTQEETTAIVFDQPTVAVPVAGETKAMVEGNKLTENGTLGLFAQEAGINNEKMNYDAQSGALTFDAGKTFSWPGTNAVDFYAYFYPQNTTGITVTDADNVTYELTNDWKTQADLLYANTKQAKNSSDTKVKLTFNHAMAWIRFNIIPAKENATPNISLVSVSYKDYLNRTFSLKNQKFAPVDAKSAIKGDVKLTSTSSKTTVPDDNKKDVTYLNSLIFPTTIDALSPTDATTLNLDITIANNGIEGSYKTNVTQQFLAGMVYTITLKYTATGIEFDATDGGITVTPWGYEDTNNQTIDVE